MQVLLRAYLDLLSLEGATVYILGLAVLKQGVKFKSYKEETGSCVCTSCILNKASCYFGDWHRWSLERTGLHAPYLVISRNAMVSFPCQEVCKEEMFYSVAS